MPQFSIITRSFIYLTHKIVEIVVCKAPDEAVNIVNGSLVKLERFLGPHSLTIKIQKIFPSYGGIMKTRKKQEKKNFDNVQIEHFGNKALHKAHDLYAP